jgi:hypothetical protein
MQCREISVIEGVGSMPALRRTVSLLLIMVFLGVLLILVGCEGVSTETESERWAREEKEQAARSARQQLYAPFAFSQAEETQIFSNSNPDAVHGGATKPLTFELKTPATISYIQTYHWDSGKPPGKISLKGPDGTIYGPWQAIGTEGQGGMPNAYWEVKPNQALQPGVYTVVDSHPGSWSTNDGMGLAGQTIVRGYVDE